MPNASTGTTGVRIKADSDTAAGCEALAAADIVRATNMDTANGREKLELSAARWTQRSELLLRLESSFERRKALDAAAWLQADADDRLSEQG
jgi:hypothetical protein